jgi:peptidyl-prolyl cis-trans isomerase D
MLKSVRHAAKSGFSYILVAGLIVIFAFFFGIPANSCGSSPNAAFVMASIDGETVDSKDINVIYNQLYSSNTAPDPAQLQRQQALSLKAYLMIELLAHKAREAGLRVSEEEFTAYMLDPLRNPEFLSAYGNTGAYNKEYYENYVQNFLLVSLPAYEDFKRDELLARKYINMVEMQVGVLPQEVEQLKKLRNTKINLAFVRFQPEALAEFVQVEDAEVAAFAAENADEIKEYYEANIDDYSAPAQMEVRRIYLELDGAGPDGKSAQERLAEAKARIDEGEDFASVAGSINDALKDQQGFMAMSPVENMNQQIVAALEGAEIGDVREVTTDSALMLVKLLDEKEATKTPLEEVELDIARTLLKEKKVSDLAEELAKQLQARAKETGSLSEALQALKPGTAAEGEADEAATETPESVWSALTVEETGEFTLEGQDMSGMFGGQLPPGISLGRSAWDRIPKIGQSRALAVAAFSKFTEEQPVADEIYTVNDSKFVVSLKSKTTAANAEAAAEDAEVEGEGEEAAAEAPEDGAGDANQQLVDELIAQKTQNLLGQWQRLFQRRTRFGSALTLDYGPWLEQLYDEAVASGLIELYPDTGGAAVTMIDPTTVRVEPALPGGEAPIEVAPADDAASDESASEESPSEESAE